MTGEPGSVHVRLRSAVLLGVAAAAGLGGASLAAARAQPAPSAGGSPRAAAARPLRWSGVRELAAGCALAPGPQVAFPSEAPALPTGPGAIVWASAPGRCGAAPAAKAAGAVELNLVPLSPAGAPGRAHARVLAPAIAGPLAAVGSSRGRVVAAAAVGAGGAGEGEVALVQQRSTGALRPPALIAGGEPLALTRAYLGDAAIATVRGHAIAVRVERYFRSGFGRARLIPLAPGRVTALIATMDYRSDVLLVWQQGGSIYAHMLPASPRAEPTQRIGPSAPDPQLQAVVSDNSRGIIAWSSTRAPSGAPARTRIYIDRSGAGVRFPAPQLVASFRDAQQVGRRRGSIELVRLATENVLFAWTAFERGHYVVRGAPAVHAASGPSRPLSDPRRQAVLADLAPGPAGEAVALWASTAQAQSDPGAPRPQLWAARAFLVLHDRVALGPAGLVAAPGGMSGATVAVDPANDRALAAWLTPAGGGSIQFALGGSAIGRQPPATSDPWLPIALAAAVLAAASGRWALVRRARRRRPAGAAADRP